MDLETTAERKDQMQDGTCGDIEILCRLVVAPAWMKDESTTR